MSRTIILLYVATTSSALIVLKYSSSGGALFDLSHAQPSVNINRYTVLGVAGYGISFLLYTYLIAKHQLGYIIPLTTALVYVVVFVASFVIFKETFTARKIAAIALILAGLWLLSSKP